MAYPAQGAVEYGRRHYPLIVIMHCLFFLSLIIEYTIAGNGDYSVVLMILYFVLIGCKAWIILSLGKYWNTRIYRAPSFPVVKKGPYNYIRHPNYVVVIGEIALIPLIFHLYYTAIIFSILNGIVLYIRIKEENRALGY
ncbi:MAG: hypothetical protein LIP01_15825 [Tannerellaceae bacterium]|nr:hypothetical protein [Tannerellaceae bacterium]